MSTLAEVASVVACKIRSGQDRPLAARKVPLMLIVGGSIGKKIAPRSRARNYLEYLSALLDTNQYSGEQFVAAVKGKNKHQLQRLLNTILWKSMYIAFQKRSLLA